jgi:apolipoprotein N-acyltransferase
MSEQQLAFAKVRAVEHDRYVVVAGTTGVSSVIAPDGGELVSTDFFTPAYLDIQVRLKTKLTPATRWAPILQWVLAAMAGAVILAGIRQNRWFPRPVRPRSKRSEDPEESGAPAGEPPPDEGGDDIPPTQGGDYTAHHRGGRPPRYLGRHRGAT